MSKYRIIACILSVMLIICTIPAFAECKRCTRRYNCTQSGCCNNYIKNCESSDSISSQAVYSSKASDIISQVNMERAKYGLSPVKVSASLTQAAYIRAQELTSVFSHTRPDGTSWSTVSAYANAENIARGYTTTDKAMAAWLTSEGHRKNIINSRYTTIGVCAYEYNGVMYWVQLFGTK